MILVFKWYLLLTYCSLDATYKTALELVLLSAIHIQLLDILIYIRYCSKC
jgi:hypothetical protein